MSVMSLYSFQKLDWNVYFWVYKEGFVFDWNKLLLIWCSIMKTCIWIYIVILAYQAILLFLWLILLYKGSIHYILFVELN